MSVKGGERTRLEKELRKEERELQKTESELRLSEQAFDQFLQENDRKAVEAMKRFVSIMMVNVYRMFHKYLPQLSSAESVNFLFTEPITRLEFELRRQQS